MEELLKEAALLAPELARLREAFHREPEPSGREERTAEKLERFFAERGVGTSRPTKTSVTAEIRGALPGPVAALRADMDALPVEELTGAPFASGTPGMMHACGHDFHMTAALGAAELLLRRRETLPGAVRFLFEPDEERNGGARAMIAAGCLEGVSAVFGCHVAPSLPAGTAGFRYGKFYAASNPFEATVLGKQAHGAEPEKGIDALYAAARMACALKQLQEPLTKKNGRTVLTVGSFHSGAACNILSGRADFSGVLRTLGPAARADALRAMRETLEAIAAETGTRLDARIEDGYSGIVNDDRATALAESAARALLGAGRVVRIGEPTMVTEDFGYYLEQAPGCFYHVGVGGGEGLHSPRFLPSAALLPGAAALHAAILLAFLARPDFTLQEEPSCRPSH